MSDSADPNTSQQGSTDSQATMLRINPTRAKELSENLAGVLKRIESSKKAPSQNVRLIAVSKLKPATDILSLHQQTPNPHLHFGENYSQELTEKAALLPSTIHWHMIGALQTNKCKPLASTVPNLWCVSSVDTTKKARELDKGRKALLEREGAEGLGALRVLVQVNTSGEAEKSGCEPGEEVLGLCRFVKEECEGLVLGGVMTIGALARSQGAWEEGAENADFVRLREVRDQVAEGLGMEKEGLELSMGMSQDFEGAIGLGSAEVRVGTGIFGERPAKKDAVVVEKEAEGKN
ncbi:hypothetical protein MBLNU230_g2037t1 [Neophaeotheca triangularis]